MRRALGMLCIGASIVCLAAASALAATINVTGNITVSTTWTSNNEYVLTQPIYVEEGATLVRVGRAIFGLRS